MSLAIASNRRRRKIVLGTATVLLHLLVLDWFSSQLGRPRGEVGQREAPPMAAELIDMPYTPPPQAQPVPPQPALAPPPLPQLPLEPVEVAQADTDTAPATATAPADGAQAGAPDAAPAAVPDAAPAAGAAGQGGAALAAADVQSSRAGAPAQPAAEPAARPAPEARRYKVDLPPPADITLDVARTDPNGTRWSGDALLSWTLTPTSYKIRVEAGITVVFAHVNLVALTSEGTVGEEGFMPSLMTEKRRGRSMTATHFNRKDGRLSFSASEANYPLVWGAQDKASVPLQLTAIARGDPQQLSGNIDILVGEDRDASVFSFKVLGQEQLDTRMGKIATWHLARPPKPGSYNSRLDLWLAPDYGWVPVQIRNLEASGAVTTQTVNNIVMKNSGS
ncbi:DUF3108 domain-containing protein [Massilia sp. LXY-6]|uniref:DUF3108 domain-containing protein n=1 Tax=Massilia sp. LXY-6 TaxID=3379823 RepID=UPI003EE2FEDE